MAGGRWQPCKEGVPLIKALVRMGHQGVVSSPSSEVCNSGWPGRCSGDGPKAGKALQATPLLAEASWDIPAPSSPIAKCSAWDLEAQAQKPLGKSAASIRPGCLASQQWTEWV